MTDKDGRPVRGEEGHWRYNKDTAAGNKFDKKGNLISTGPPEPPQTGKDTSTKTPGIFPKKIPKKKGTPDPNGVYDKEVAEGFNKDEQKNLLKARGIKFRARDSEAQLVAKILKSNPEEETQGAKDLPGVPNDITEEEAREADERAADVPPERPKETTKYGAELENYKASALVTILKSLGVGKIPLTNKGKIKKILETQ